MSTEKLDAYKDLYSKYVKELVNVHNYHQVFVIHVGNDSGREIRESLRKMIDIEKKLRKLSLEAYKEHRENIKEERAKLREMRAKAKPRKMPVHKGRKNNGHNN